MASLPGWYNQQFFKDNGDPAANWRVYTYASGTTTQKDAYIDAAGVTPQTYTSDGLGGQYIALNARGELTAPLFLGTGAYDIVLKDDTGATEWTRYAIGTDSSADDLEARLASTDPGDGAELVGFDGSGGGLSDRTVDAKLNEILTVADFGALGAGADESAAAAAMIGAVNKLVVPSGFTLVAKNIALNNNTQVIVDGTLKLPSACSDFDRLLYAASKSGVQIKINEIDGNYTGQSGAIGTHLIYLTNCPDATVHVRYAHDNYISTAAAMTAVDGIRNTSTGPIYLYESDRADVNVNLLSGWGREGIYLEQCDDATVAVGHCQGHATRNTEYSGVQVKGNRNKLVRASVDFAGASGVGFDTVDGVCENIISTNTRENHGVNFGHPGFPASRSVASNIVVDGAFVDGIKVSSATTDLTVQNFAIRNAGRYGFSLSDSSVRGKLTNGIFANSGQSNLQVAVTEVQTANVRSSDLDSASIEVTLSSGTFVAGETVSVGGNSATIRKAIRNLSLTKQILFLTSVTGSFAVSDVVTGGTSGATGTVSVSSIPTQRLEQTGGIFAEDVRLFTGTQDQIRFPDGTAILSGTVSVVVATGGTLQTLATNYSANVTWASTPRIVAQINSANSTSAYSVTQMRVSTTTTAFTINLNASVAQTYGVTVMVIGRWK